jgi:hypothetical protein
MLSVTIQNALILGVVMQSVKMLRIVMLSHVILIVVKQSCKGISVLHWVQSRLLEDCNRQYGP